MINFNDAERLCQSRFDLLGKCWHLWTPDNYKIIFPDDGSFMKGMGIIAICAALFPDIAILTFELMTNHLHITVAGEEARIREMFSLIKKTLSRTIQIDLTDWDCKLRRIMDLQDARNVITYNNRNGFLVNDDESPFSYRWGANSFYFNREAKARYYESGTSLPFNERRRLMASHKADSVTWLRKTDGYVSPLSFCAIEKGESLFRNASHYFYEISRNIESQKAIAKEIGERIFYTDNELFTVVIKKVRDNYGDIKPSLLPIQAKLEIAKQLHYEYNASNKQIQRMLSMDIKTVEELFPSGRNA
jgi:REP element-mobilizing transposase RayT